MTTEPTTRRYEMVNVRQGYLIIEQENHTFARRSYFAAERTPPLEEYREGDQFWKPHEAAQTFQFDVRDTTTGEVVPFGELVGLLYYACCAKGTAVHQMGDLAHDQQISLYVAITTEGAGGLRASAPREGPGPERALQRAPDEPAEEGADPARPLRPPAADHLRAGRDRLRPHVHGMRSTG